MSPVVRSGVLSSALVLGVVTFGAGCSTPAPVLELADRTAANAGVLATRLQQAAQESDRLYAARVQNIGALTDGVAAQRSVLDLDVLLTKRAGQQADLDLLEEIRKRRTEAEALTAPASGDAAQQRRKALLDAQVKVDTRAAALQAVAEKLATLAQEASAAERARLFARFARAVRDDVQKELDSGSAAAGAAQALIEQLKSDLKPAAKTN